jgi:hypothetical protein
MSTTHEKLRRLVDHHFDGGLSANDEALLREHLPGCESCRQAYESYQVAERLGATTMDARDRLGRALGLGRARGGRRWALGTLAVAGAAAALLLLAGPRHPGPAARGPAIDGAEALDVATFRLHGHVSTRVEHAVAAGDELAFAYRNELGKAYLMIFAVDGDGHVLWYHPAWTNPADNPKAVAISKQIGFKELPEAIRQPVHGPRLSLYSLFMDEPLDVRSVEARIAAGAPLGDVAAGEVLHKVELEVVP